VPPFAEDLGDFFDAEDGFATAGTLDGAPVAGILARPSAEALGMIGEAPYYVLPAAQAPASSGGTLVLVGVGSFLIVAPPEQDGTGLARLTLRALA
jgi:hypothetical protein